MSFGISADCAANAFALTNRCQTFSHRCLARILTSGGVPEPCPDTAHWAFAGQPRGNSCPKERSLPLVLRLVVAKSVNSVSAFGAKSSVHFLTPPLPTKPADAGLWRGPNWGAQQHRRKSSWGASTAVECRNCNRKTARFHLFGVLFLLSSFPLPPL